MSFRDDVRAVLERDPAATNLVEVLLTYPGLHAIVLHRVSHGLHRRGVPVVPRLISHLGRWLTGIEIHPGATVGRGLFIDHGMGLVIGETSEIGDNVTLHQDVTLGGTGKERGKRHPTLGDDVYVGVGAKILGAVRVGEGARIGAGAVVLSDVPAHTTAVGVPAKVVVYREPDGSNRRVEHLPDPELDMISGLYRRIEELADRVESLERAARERQEAGSPTTVDARRSQLAGPARSEPDGDGANGCRAQPGGSGGRR
jgi:serine O-acetyltransferase